MTGHVGDVEKFALCEFRLYEVFPPETDTPTSLRNRKKKGKGLLTLNLSQVNVCLPMAERGLCASKDFSVMARSSRESIS